MKILCGENIKKQRILNGMTQTELGNSLGVKHGAVSSWENNRTEPNMGQIEKMCRIFGCKKTDLIDTYTEIPEFVPGSAEILDLYSRATPEQRQAVLSLLRSFVPN